MRFVIFILTLILVSSCKSSAPASSVKTIYTPYVNEIGPFPDNKTEYKPFYMKDME